MGPKERVERPDECQIGQEETQATRSARAPAPVHLLRRDDSGVDRRPPACAVILRRQGLAGRLRISSLRALQQEVQGPLRVLLPFALQSDQRRKNVFVREIDFAKFAKAPRFGLLRAPRIALR
jgi:hypothetical protein